MSMIKGIKWNEIETVIRCTNRSLLYGPPGTGKTTCGINVGKSDGKKVYSVTLHSDITAQELIGHFIPKGGEFVFHHGPFIRAWNEGAVLIINEICEAGGPVLTALYSILDDPSIAMLTLPDGNTVKPSEGFQAIATMNGALESLPAALLDRFEVMIEVTEPHPSAVAKLPKKYHKFIKHVYSSSSFSIMSLRSVFSYENLRRQDIPVTLALDCVYGNNANDVREVMKATDVDPM